MTSTSPIPSGFDPNRTTGSTSPALSQSASSTDANRDPETSRAAIAGLSSPVIPSFSFDLDQVKTLLKDKLIENSGTTEFHKGFFEKFPPQSVTGFENIKFNGKGTFAFALPKTSEDLKPNDYPGLSLKAYAVVQSGGETKLVAITNKAKAKPRELFDIHGEMPLSFEEEDERIVLGTKIYSYDGISNYERGFYNVFQGKTPFGMVLPNRETKASAVPPEMKKSDVYKLAKETIHIAKDVIKKDPETVKEFFEEFHKNQRQVESEIRKRLKGCETDFEKLRSSVFLLLALRTIKEYEEGIKPQERERFTDLERRYNASKQTVYKFKPNVLAVLRPILWGKNLQNPTPKHEDREPEYEGDDKGECYYPHEYATWYKNQSLSGSLEDQALLYAIEPIDRIKDEKIQLERTGGFSRAQRIPRNNPFIPLKILEDMKDQGSQEIIDYANEQLGIDLNIRDESKYIMSL